MKKIIHIKKGKFGEAFDRMAEFLEENDAFEMRIVGRPKPALFKIPDEKKTAELVLRFPAHAIVVHVRRSARNPRRKH